MNAWLQFQMEHPAPAVASLAESASYFCVLSDDGIIAARGPDAAVFLHSQLTNDVSNLRDDEARLAGLCTAKGRLLATFLLWKSDDAICLQLPAELREAIRKRLQMFVLRAKVGLTDETDQTALLGLYGDGARRFLASRFPDFPDRAFAVVRSENGVAIRLTDALGRPRYQWITSCDNAVASWPALESDMQLANPRAWRHLDIRAGIPRVVAATQERFVPQMINFEIVGGVNFRKGCYPGQEIVARSQYLGKLKRRMYPAHVDAIDVLPGTEVFSSSDPTQPSGMVVNAEPDGSGGSDCLVELKSAARFEGTIHLGSSAGPLLHFRELPYSLEEST